MKLKKCILALGGEIDFSQNYLTLRGGGPGNTAPWAICIASFTSSASTLFFFAEFDNALASSNN